MSRRFLIAAAAAVALALALCLSSSPVSVSAFELTMESPEVRNSAYFRFAAVDADALAHLSFPTETSLLALRSHARGEPIAPGAAPALAGNATAVNATAPQGGFDLGVAKLDKTYTRAEARELWRQQQATFKRGKPYSPKEEEERFIIFEKNLQSVGEQNFKHGGGFSAMSAYADLSRAEFLKMKGLKFKEATVIEKQGRDLKASSRERRAKAYRDWKSFRDTFGLSAPNPHRTPYNETAAGKAKVQRYRLMKAKAAARKAALAVSKAKKAKAAAALKVKQAALRVAKTAKKSSSAQKIADKKAKAKKEKEAKSAKIKASQAKKLAAKKKKAEETAKKSAAKKAAAAEKKAALAAKKAAAKAAKAAKAAAKSAPKSLLEVDVAAEADAEAESEAESGADAEVDADADADAESEVEAESEADADSEAEMESEAESLEAEMQSMLDGDAELLSFIQLDAEVDMEAEVEAGADMSPAPTASAPGVEPLASARLTSKQRKAAQAKKAAAAARAKAAEAAKVAAQAAADAKAAAAAKVAAEAKAAAQAKAAKAAAEAKATAAMAAATAAAKALADAKAAEAAAKPAPANAVPADGELVSAEDISAPAVPAKAATPAAPAKPATPAAPAKPTAPAATTPTSPAKPATPATPAAAAGTTGSATGATGAAAGAASSTGAVGPVQPVSSSVVVADAPLGISYPGEDKDYKPVAKKAKKGASATPVNIDWRTRSGVLTPIKSQGQCGSCWAQSAVSVVESAIAIKTNRTAKPLSVQQLVSCDTADLGCEGGNPITALQYLSNYAVAAEKSYPYDAAVFSAGTPVPACDTKLQSEKFPPVKEVATYESGDEEGIMRALLNGPVTALVDASTWQFYDGTKIVYPASGCKGDVDSLDHSVVIVGVGTLDNGERYYIVRNHWDSNWGSQGYIFLAAGLNTCGIALQVSEITLASHVGV